MFEYVIIEVIINDEGEREVLPAFHVFSDKDSDELSESEDLQKSNGHYCFITELIKS